MTKTYINYAVTVLVILVMLSLTAGAFVLSFDALQKEAIIHGIDPALAWIFPVIVDLAVIAGGSFVIWAAINSLVVHKRMGYLFILAVTAMSVTLNAFHAQGGWMSVVYSVIPPMMLAATIFIVERMIEHVISQLDSADKLQSAYDSLAEANKQTIDRLRQIQARYNELETRYTQLAEYVPLLPVIHPDVFVAARAAAGLITQDEAVGAQTLYERRNQWDTFFKRVTVEVNHEGD